MHENDLLVSSVYCLVI